MKSPDDGLREKRFVALAKAAQTQLFEENGEVDPATILERVVSTDSELWKAMQQQLAEQAALALIKALMKRTPHMIDADEQLDLFPNMPRVITFKRKQVNLLKASAAELAWYGDWWNLRLEGLAKRTQEDLAISGEIERLKRALRKYDPDGTVESALKIRTERLEAAATARERRRRKAKQHSKA